MEEIYDDTFRDLEDETPIPTQTYYLQNGRITGRVDGFEAMLQAVDKLLNTERFVYNIYTEFYGVELERFIGAPKDFVLADVEREIEETLQSDDRIEGISDFEIEETKRNTLYCRFNVDTIEGSFSYESEVAV